MEDEASDLAIKTKIVEIMSRMKQTMESQDKLQLIEKLTTWKVRYVVLANNQFLWVPSHYFNTLWAFLVFHDQTNAINVITIQIMRCIFYHFNYFPPKSIQSFHVLPC